MLPRVLRGPRSAYMVEGDLLSLRLTTSPECLPFLVRDSIRPVLEQGNVLLEFRHRGLFLCERFQTDASRALLNSAVGIEGDVFDEVDLLLFLENELRAPI